MKRNRYLPVWLSLVLLLLIFYACEKNATESIPEQNSIEKAMQYFNETNAIAKSGETETTKSFKPDWNTAYVTKLADGSTSVVVPAVGFKFEDDSKLSFLRFFIFKEQDNQISFGRIIEAYGNKENMPGQKQQIISSFDQNQIKGFEGAILSYDVNYKYIGGTTFKSGVRVEGNARLGQQNKPGKPQPVITDSGKSKNRIASTHSALNEPGCGEMGVYLVLTYEDGHTEWYLMYTYSPCAPPSGGTWPYPGNTNPGGGGAQYIDAMDPGDAYLIVSNSKVAIPLAQKLNCFNLLPNTGATYSVKICADLVNNSSPGALLNQNFEQGHAFITLMKTVGGATVSESFGFYPALGQTALFNNPVSSMIVNDEGHEYNASMEVNVSESQFNTAMATALSESSKQYNLAVYNWTDFALAVFNSAVPPADQLVVPDWSVNLSRNYGRTPPGLYGALHTRSTTDSRASVSTANSPASTNCP